MGHAVSQLPAEIMTTRFWHGDCFADAMTDDRYLTLLLWTICVLTFACSVVAITEHPEWFGA
jgi:hypothetical protein